MTNRFEDLWSSAADDGASSLVGVYTSRQPDLGAEVDHLLDAWLRERTVRIEYSLVLEQVQRVIAGLLAESEITPRRRREASRLIRAIRVVQKEDPGEY